MSGEGRGRVKEGLGKGWEGPEKVGRGSGEDGETIGRGSGRVGSGSGEGLGRVI